jgi:hypothetical protein
MKKFLLVFSFLFSTIVSFAQISTVEKQLAIELIKQNQIQLGLTDFDVENTVVFIHKTDCLTRSLNASGRTDCVLKSLPYRRRPKTFFIFAHQKFGPKYRKDVEYV